MKDTWYRFNISQLQYRDFLEEFSTGTELEQTDYAEVHNIIYGAIAFAEDYGFSPHSDFKLARMILEEDTEEVPLIEYEFGVEGKPQLVVNHDDPKTPFYLNKLDKYAGKGNYELVFLNFDGEDDDDEYSPVYDDEYLSEPKEYELDEWEDFILETDPENLVLLRAESLYIFEKAVFEPTMAKKKLAAEGNTMVRDIHITYEPLENKQSEEEAKEGEEIYRGLHMEENSTKALNRLLDRIKIAIGKWPENPIFYNYLSNAYILLGQEQKEKEAILALIEQFPDYFFGKLSYAQLLIEEGKLDAIPQVFNNRFDLKSILPDREMFHITELVSFHTIMCRYFMEKDDLCSAHMYRKIIDELDIPEHLQRNEELFFRLNISIIMQVKELIMEAQQDENKRKELVEVLMP